MTEFEKFGIKPNISDCEAKMLIDVLEALNMNLEHNKKYTLRAAMHARKTRKQTTMLKTASGILIAQEAISDRIELLEEVIKNRGEK